MKIYFKIIIILLALYSSFFLFASILSPISAYFGYYELSEKLTFLFVYSCHQEPERCFWILGYPVALCCRCLGVYLGVVLSCIFLLLGKLKINFKVFTALIVLNFIDIFINYGMGIRAHNTGNLTRFLVGISLGLIIVLILQKLIERKKHD